MITLKELEHLATLARIKLSDEDKQSLLGEFDSILKYIDQIKAVDANLADGVQMGRITNVTRADEAKPISNEERENLLNLAPQRVGDFIAVKKIIEQ